MVPSSLQQTVAQGLLQPLGPSFERRSMRLEEQTYIAILLVPAEGIQARRGEVARTPQVTRVNGRGRRIGLKGMYLGTGLPLLQREQQEVALNLTTQC